MINGICVPSIKTNKYNTLANKEHLIDCGHLLSQIITLRCVEEKQRTNEEIESESENKREKRIQIDSQEKTPSR